MAKSTLTTGRWIPCHGAGGTVNIETSSLGNDLLPIATLRGPDREANAQLIAAAPDMLEALKNIENDDKHMPETAWNLIQAAIAKAQGAPA